MADIYRRPEMAVQMAKQLLHPGVLDEGLRSGLFLSGVRRTGKTTFLLNDLIPFIGTGSHRALVNELTARRRGPHHCHRSPLPRRRSQPWATGQRKCSRHSGI